eukprot:14806153-Alexandrium_andersonii.AAC.1
MQSPRCRGDSHGGPRNDPSSRDGDAIFAGGVCVRVLVAVVDTAGLRMCNEHLALVWWGSISQSRQSSCTCATSGAKNF